MGCWLVIEATGNDILTSKKDIFGRKLVPNVSKNYKNVLFLVYKFQYCKDDNELRSKYFLDRSCMLSLDS